jgi:hypothetical protein
MTTFTLDFLRLKGKTMSIHMGEAVTRLINIFVGTPQGSVLAATLFRLHVHFLPSFFMNLTCRLFADDLAIVIPRALKNRFSKNIVELGRQSGMAMNVSEKYADDNLLPLNINKTKALFVHDVETQICMFFKFEIRFYLLQLYREQIADNESDR